MRRALELARHQTAVVEGAEGSHIPGNTGEEIERDRLHSI
jgi:hypothetical protein